MEICFALSYEHMTTSDIFNLFYAFNFFIFNHIAWFNQQTKDLMLIRSCGYGNIEITRYLLAYGANADAHDNKAIGEAALNGHTEIVAFLSDYYDNYNLLQAYYAACTTGRVDVVDFFRRYGIDIRASNDKGFYLACTNGRLELARYLIQKGIKIHPVDFYGASINGQTCIVQLFLDEGVPVHQLALSNTAANGHLETVRLLLQYGATPCEKAIKWALEGGFDEIVNLLVSSRNTFL